jgi:hypothetical protein
MGVLLVFGNNNKAAERRITSADVFYEYLLFECFL